MIPVAAVDQTHPVEIRDRRRSADQSAIDARIRPVGVGVDTGHIAQSLLHRRRALVARRLRRHHRDRLRNLLDGRIGFRAGGAARRHIALHRTRGRFPRGGFALALLLGGWRLRAPARLAPCLHFNLIEDDGRRLRLRDRMSRIQNSANATQRNTNTHRSRGTAPNHNAPVSFSRHFLAGENGGWLGTHVLRGEFTNPRAQSKADLIAHAAA
jgi:hypothetical protein